MRFSRLSTISFGHINDFQRNGVMLAVPIIPRGAFFTIVENGDDEIMAEGGQNSHTLPDMITFIKRGGEFETAIHVHPEYDGVPCVFQGQVPLSMPCGRYVARFDFENEDFDPIFSDEFEVVLDDGTIAEIEANNVEDRYADGTPSVLAGKQIFFQHYFARNDFYETISEKNENFDNEKGFALPLLNQNHTKHTLKGYCSEYTSNAIGILAASSYVMFTYKDKENAYVCHDLKKAGEYTSETLSVKTRAFSCDFYAKRVPEALPLIEKEQYDIGFKINGQILKVPYSWCCHPYRNFYGATENGNAWLIDFGDLYAKCTDIYIYRDYLPDNFLQCLCGRKMSGLVRIHHADKVRYIGDFAFLGTTNNVRANFSNLEKVGKGVVFPKNQGTPPIINGETQKRIDGIDFGGAQPFITKGKVVVSGYKFTNNVDVLSHIDFSVIENCEFEYNGFNSLPLLNKPDKLTLKNCHLAKSSVGSSNFCLYDLQTCNFEGCTADDGIILTTSNSAGDKYYSGHITDSFNGAAFRIDNHGGSANFTANANSFNGNIEENGTPYLLTIQQLQGRSLTAPTTPLVVENPIVTTYDGDIISAGATFHTHGWKELSTSNSDIAKNVLDIDFPFNYKTKTHEFEGFKIYNNVQNRIIDFKNVVFSSNSVNGIRRQSPSRTAAIELNGSQHLQIQTKKNVLNDLSCDIWFYNDFNANFDYQLLRANPSVLQGFTGEISVYNDTDGSLTNRLQELYPDYTITNIPS